MFLPAARQSRPGLSPKAYSAERCVNLFARQSDGVSQLPLMGRSGFVSLAALDGEIRSICGMGGDIYASAGGYLWQVTSSGAVTNIGHVPDDAQTYMAASRNQLAIVAGGQYLVCQGGAVASYAPGAIETARGVAYLDGFFIVSGEIGGREDYVQASALDDGRVFDALDFAAAESSPDELVALMADHGELWLIGSRSVEVWYNAGTLQFPFAPNPAARVEHGCLNGKTVAKADNAVFWVGENGIVYRSGGGMPTVISTREIEEEIGRATIEGGFTFTDRGHQFYAVSRRDKTTLVYDMTTGLWAERSTGVADGEWICTSAHLVGGVEYFGTSTGKVGYLSDEVYTDDGDVISAEVVTQPLDNKGGYIAVGKFEAKISSGFTDLGLIPGGAAPLETEDGQTLETESGLPLEVDAMVARKPRVMLQVSRDGFTWGQERWRELGPIGHYGSRAVWHGMGAGRRMQARLRITDPVKRDIYGVSYE